jgi:cell division protein FtsQ
VLPLFRRKNRRRKPEGRRFELPAIDWRLAGRRAAALAAVAGLGGLLASGLDRPLQRVIVDAPYQRVSPVELEQAVRAGMHGGFVSADLDRLRAAIEKLVWVDRARVQRRWPDGLYLQVVEQIPAARWGEDGLLNTRGELFMTGAQHVPPELPRLNGPAGTEATVAQRYLATQGRLLEQGLRLTRLSLDERGGWEMSLANGVTVRLGRRQVDERMERFLRVAAQVIAGHAAEVAYVDMRYSNGFSVGWRNGSAPAQGRPAAVATGPQNGERDNDA